MASHSVTAISELEGGITAIHNDHEKKLLHLASRACWKEVVEICTATPGIMSCQVFSNEETVFHVAVVEDQPKMLEQLVGMVSDGEMLEIGDGKGNNPLHLAASTGKTDMAICLLRKRPELLGIPNKDNETPLFVAAASGKKDTFLYLLSQCPPYLLSQCPPDQGIEYWRGRDGNTILHVAISGEYFDLAFQILRKCNKNTFAVKMNERGQSPLHLLASNPSAFKSGSHLNRFEKVLYNCVVVEKLKVSSFNEKDISKTQTKPHRLPANYMVCMTLIEVIKKIFMSIMRLNFKDSEVSDGENEPPQLPFPTIYETWYNAVELTLVLLLQVIGFGFIRAQNFIEKKQKHTWAVQVLDELLDLGPQYSWQDCGGNYRAGPTCDLPKEDFPPEVPGTDPPVVERESPLLVAAKMGVKEMVKRILIKYPSAIRDVNQDGKNVVLLAVENRQPAVYKLLKSMFACKYSPFQHVDKDGNSVLHFAATCKPWLVPGAALQMQSEIKWYQFIKKTLPTQSISRLNKKGQTDKTVFNETHKDLVKQGGDWLNNASQSCSVVAALIATVAFATATANPGSHHKNDRGEPHRGSAEDTQALGIFSIASLIALCFSFASLIVFLSILTSGHEEHSFYQRLTAKLIFGFTSLFISMASILVSFYASIWFMFKHDLNIAIFPVFGITCLPIAFAAVTLFPLYKYLIKSFLYSHPQRT